MSTEEGANKEVEVQAGWVRLFCNVEHCDGSLTEPDPSRIGGECAVCIESLEGLSVAVVNPCRHLFCESCIGVWHTK